MPSTEYTARVAGYDREALESELEALRSLYAKLHQEYKDRAETLWLVSNQMDEVRARLADYEEAPF